MLLIQEHWLLPHEINFLSSIHPDFNAFGHSAVDIASGVLTGRPFGGTGILYKKSISKHVNHLDTFDSRITAVILHASSGPILLVSVYMPTDYGDDDSYDNYLSTCAKITALYEDCAATKAVIAGDFNCQNGSRFFKMFKKICS